MLNGVEARADHFAASCDEQDTQHAVARVVGELFERVEVHDGLVDRDRNEVLNLECKCVAQFLRLHPRQVDLSHDDLLVRDAEHDTLRRELGLRPKDLERGGHCLAVEHLAIDNSTDWQRDLSEPLEGVPTAACRKLGGAYRRRPDVETHGPSSSHDAFPSRTAVIDRSWTGYLRSLVRTRHRKDHGPP